MEWSATRNGMKRPGRASLAHAIAGLSASIGFENPIWLRGTRLKGSSCSRCALCVATNPGA